MKLEINKKNPAYYAFFDVDGTLIKGTPMLDFLKFYYQKRYASSKWMAALKYKLFEYKSKILISIGKSREVINHEYYRCYQGQDIDWITQLGDSWFVNVIHNNLDSYITNVLTELTRHVENEAEIVLVSGSFSACLDSFAKTFNIKNVLATSLEVKNNKFTGKLNAPQTIGVGKKIAIKKFLEDKNFYNYHACYAYGDHISDLPMLSLVGNPVVVKGNKKLEEYARENNWKIIE